MKTEQRLPDGRTYQEWINDNDGQGTPEAFAELIEEQESNLYVGANYKPGHSSDLAF